MMSNESSVTVPLLRFFHQCATSCDSTATSPCRVDDRGGAVAGVFVDLALDDVDQRRPVAVTMPRDDAARLDRELADAHLAVLQHRPLFGERKHGEHGVGDADRLDFDRLARIRHLLLRRAFPGESGSREDDAGKQPATTSAEVFIPFNIACLLNLCRDDASGMGASIGNVGDERKYRVRTDLIERRYQVRAHLPRGEAQLPSSRDPRKGCASLEGAERSTSA